MDKKKFLLSLEIIFSALEVITLYCNNNGEVANVKEPRNHQCGKYIDIKVILIRDIDRRGGMTIYAKLCR